MHWIVDCEYNICVEVEHDCTLENLFYHDAHRSSLCQVSSSVITFDHYTSGSLMITISCISGKYLSAYIKCLAVHMFMKHRTVNAYKTLCDSPLVAFLLILIIFGQFCTFQHTTCVCSDTFNASKECNTCSTTTSHHQLLTKLIIN